MLLKNLESIGPFPSGVRPAITGRYQVQQKTEPSNLILDCFMPESAAHTGPPFSRRPCAAYSIEIICWPLEEVNEVDCPTGFSLGL